MSIRHWLLTLTLLAIGFAFLAAKIEPYRRQRRASAEIDVAFRAKSIDPFQHIPMLRGRFSQVRSVSIQNADSNDEWEFSR